MEESEEHMREVVVPRNVTEALVNVFRPNSRNLVRVCAYNDVYNGPPSDSIDFTTPEGSKKFISFFFCLVM